MYPRMREAVKLTHDRHPLIQRYDTERLVGHLEVIQRDLFHHLPETLAFSLSAWADQRVLRPRLAAHGFNFRMARQPSRVARLRRSSIAALDKRAGQ